MLRKGVSTNPPLPLDYTASLLKEAHREQEDSERESSEASQQLKNGGGSDVSTSTSPHSDGLMTQEGFRIGSVTSIVMTYAL